MERKIWEKKIIGPGGNSYQAKTLWKKEIWDRCNEIDPKSEYHWESLAIGWAIAHGMGIEDAIDFGYDYPMLD